MSLNEEVYLNYSTQVHMLQPVHLTHVWRGILASQTLIHGSDHLTTSAQPYKQPSH